MLTICQHPKSGSSLLDGIAISTSGSMSRNYSRNTSLEPAESAQLFNKFSTPMQCAIHSDHQDNDRSGNRFLRVRAGAGVGQDLGD